MSVCQVLHANMRGGVSMQHSRALVFFGVENLLLTRFCMTKKYDSAYKHRVGVTWSCCIEDATYQHGDYNLYPVMYLVYYGHCLERTEPRSCLEILRASFFLVVSNRLAIRCWHCANVTPRRLKLTGASQRFVVEYCRVEMGSLVSEHDMAAGVRSSHRF